MDTAENGRCNSKLSVPLRKCKNILNTLLYYSRCKSNHLSPKINAIEFICYGNICRSVFAEKYGSTVLKKEGFELNVSSSGIFAKEGTASPIEAVRAASLFKVDLSNHHSRKTTWQSLKKADLVLCMHFNHCLELWKKFPVYRDRIFLLKDFTSPISFNLNIEDPYGKNTDSYIRCFKEIAVCVERLTKRIGTDSGMKRLLQHPRVFKSEKASVELKK